MTRTLGTCYYPEHWPEAWWPEDARRMADLGLTWVRIGEFAWSKIEPAPGALRWDWLDRAVDVLTGAGLRVVMGTPTATPPRWMLTKHPDMLAVDAQGHPRGFGSRRHYCFSHRGYRKEAVRIATLMAERYGDRVAAWQTDNEYGCHDTVLSYSDAARDAFRDWLRRRYQTTDQLNAAWGNVFWSMDYASFDEIDLPNLTVTEPNPSHAMAFRRFASDEVVAFNRAQVDAIRAHSDAPIAHNYMGRVTEFDHYEVGADLDIASWDSYPMGFLLDRVGASEADKQAYLRQGDPDFQAFHHDLYRAVGRDRWWVMEQQPGPVNWAPWNPAPLPGMVRLWSWEAFAHGAEAVCWFRWRQAPMAQEQQHAGLLRPDSAPAQGFHEAAQVARELAEAPEVAPVRAPVALVFDYASQWAWEVQPQGQGFDHFGLCLDLYRGLRGLGLSVDILPPDSADLSGYALTLVPGLLNLSDALRAAIAAAPGLVLTGPRTDLKSPEIAIRTPLGPDLPGLPAQSVMEETFPDRRQLERGGAIKLWLEHLETEADVIERTADGTPVLLRAGRRFHLTGWPDRDAARRLLGMLAREAGLGTIELPDGLRVRDTGTERFVFNYAAHPQEFEGHLIAAADLLRLPRPS
ncbi:beta-galactosidase [Jannaschia seohaensis]|uniref:Beta-galactosidase n=1 Tax=Jannaschia seohaensis TaxID=475081 RepID=A0A2Y9B0M6_9RHOB|nr:beta-galactosidase [Jannaschia seohaensis]PWJ15097.1 beta-galactosidase [Jannaschia seohaensis]SSA49946.1 beta-galactosidase [Jannaschia seohaensis]